MIDRKALVGKRIYLDANVLIYFIEGTPVHVTALENLFKLIDDAAVTAFTSELSIAEVLVKPIADGRQDVIERYDELFRGSSSFKIAPVTRLILLESAHLRATIGGKLFDTIHVATAVDNHCSLFLSNDARIKSPPSVRPLTLTELGKAP